jgi:hypothetical protein
MALNCAGLLFGLSSNDVGSLIAAVAVVSGTGPLARYIPARVDPVVAPRAE